MPLKKEDTERALQVMEACQAQAADGVKGRAERLLNIFQSDLFQALLDIQEFYELTVCESQTSSRPHTPAQKYRYHDDEPPVDPSPGHMTHSAELSHAHLDGFTAALTVGTTLPTMHLVPERPPGGSSSFMSYRLRHHYGPDRTRTTGPGQNPLIMFCSGSDQ
ncbi:disks large homolog 4-like [Xiphophorus couchianus]|uniref:disks large homolog 4-like n=1 Tax=Xiphophorus couchianus TaxID=32473 RepID=UPI00101624D4|nr:disks large homolog 4-like [Xiphophorus couchianus]